MSEKRPGEGAGAAQPPSWRRIVPAGVALAAVAYLWGSRAAPPAMERTGVWSSESERRLAALEHELQQLRDVTTALAARVQQALPQRGEREAEAAAEERRSAGAREAAEERASEALSPEEERRAALEARGAFLEDLGDRLDAEPADPSWRRRTEPAIARVVGEQLGPQVRVDEVFCASSLCRAKVLHPEWPHLPNEKFLQLVMNRDGLEPMQLQMDAREEGLTLLYFLRTEAVLAQQE